MAAARVSFWSRLSLLSFVRSLSFISVSDLLTFVQSPFADRLIGARTWYATAVLVCAAEGRSF